MTEDSSNVFDIHAFVTAHGVEEEQNFKSESSIQDCLILREKFNSKLIERCWISDKFLCTSCGRQLSIVDLFNSESMVHGSEFMNKWLDLDSGDFTIVNGPKRTVKITCDCGKSDEYSIPESAIKTPLGKVLAYTRSGGCYSPS